MKWLPAVTGAIKFELATLSNIDRNENVLRLIGGITKSDNKFCMVTELCEFGCLEKYLRTKARHELFLDEIVPIADSNGVNGNDYAYKVSR